MTASRFWRAVGIEAAGVVGAIVLALIALAHVSTTSVSQILYYDGEYICGIAVSSRDHSVEFNIPKRLFRVGFAPGTVTRYTPLAVTADGSRIVFPFVRDSSGANVIHIATPIQLKR